MTQQVTIIEVRGRSEQGVTHPFICRGDDGNFYWVKGAGAGKRALCCEWIAGRLAQKLGLPIPPSAQVMVPKELIEASPRSDIHELGAGLAFGSQDVKSVQEFNIGDIRRVKPELRWKILVFDWWVQNQDRTLGERGGNPNILWDVDRGSPWIIDHNMAFDPTFNLESFWATHVFAAGRGTGAGEEWHAVHNRMEALLTEVGQIVLELPREWRYLDADFSDPIDFYPEMIQGMLLKIRTDFSKDFGLSS